MECHYVTISPLPDALRILNKDILGDLEINDLILKPFSETCDTFC